MMLMTKAELPDVKEGYLLFPRRISLAVLWIALGILATGATSAWALMLRIDRLEQTDIAYKARMDERRAYYESRLGALQTKTDRIDRLEERIDYIVSGIKEIKDELKRR